MISSFETFDTVLFGYVKSIYETPKIIITIIITRNPKIIWEKE